MKLVETNREHKMSTSLFATFLLLLASKNSAFNLETRIPVIKTGGSYDDSYFGYSVAQHNTGREPVILVGAPRDKNLQPGTNQSGALYSCAISSGIKDCVQVETDGRRHKDGIYDGSIRRLNPPNIGEIKEGQWMGVSVVSQGSGGKVIVCAHRYTVRDIPRHLRHEECDYKKAMMGKCDTKRGMLGMCYILERDLTLPRSNNIGATSILVIKEALRGKKLDLIDDFDNHAKFGVCQVGTSVSWVKDSSFSKNYALFGAPGCFTWRGNVFGQRTGVNVGYQKAVNNENFLKYTKHGHLGLAVASGRFFDNQLQFVSGAPHVRKDGSGTGEIYFFQADQVTDRLQRDEVRTLRGGKFGAGFGFVLQTLDVNGDGADDLIVSAPFADNEGRGGSVFLYINTGSGLNQENQVQIRGNGPHGQFGLAVANMGDINKDGLEDFAVGAPYEGRGVVYVFLGSRDGWINPSTGSTGSNPIWLKAEVLASQVIKATDLLAFNHLPIPATLNTFGSSLSGGMDLDNNNYPDLVIGAYNSNSVFLLRARPIINVTTSLHIDKLAKIDPGKAGCTADPDSEDACFDFKACFKIETNKTRQGMTIEFMIVGDPKKKIPRVWLSVLGSGDKDVRSNNISHVLDIQDTDEAKCTTIVGYVANKHTDFLTPVAFDLSYSLIQEEPTMSYETQAPLPKMVPILNQVQARRQFYGRFQKDCGSDNLCQAQVVIRPTLHDGLEELGKNLKGIYELNMGSLKGNELVLRMVVENLGEAAYESTLDVIMPDSLDYINLTPDSKLSSPQIINSSLLRFDLGNPFKGNTSKGPHSLDVGIRFNPRSMAKKSLIQFEFVANTSSELVVDSSTYLRCLIVRRAEVKITGIGMRAGNVFYGGRVRGESALSDISEIGPRVRHTYVIRNNGPSDVEVVTVNIKWPFQVENNKPQGKWLLYLTEHPILKNGKGICNLPLGRQPNPLNLNDIGSRNHGTKPQNLLRPDNDPDNATSEWYPEVTSEYIGSGRPKREVEQIVNPMRVHSSDPDTPDELHVKLDCDRGTAKCLTVTCQIYDLRSDRSVKIEIWSRLWNSTLVEDYSEVDRVEIYSRAQVIVDPVYTQDVSDDQWSVVTVALPDVPPLDIASPWFWWIYIIAALCGLFVLIVIVFVLWKLGFFQRKRVNDDDADYMVSANFEKMRLNGNSQ